MSHSEHKTREAVENAYTDAKGIAETDPQKYPPGVVSAAVGAAIPLALYAGSDGFEGVEGIDADSMGLTHTPAEAQSLLNDLLPLGEEVLNHKGAY
jgi:hypothetical protein